MSANTINVVPTSPSVSLRSPAKASASDVQSVEKAIVRPENADPSKGVTGSAVEPSVRAEQSAPIGKEELSKAAERLNGLAQSIRRELRFSVDDDSGRTVIRVVDSETNELIRQIPSEDVLALISQMQGDDGGLLREQA
jgi:flagellar protein FlaG